MPIVQIGYVRGGGATNDQNTDLQRIALNCAGRAPDWGRSTATAGSDYLWRGTVDAVQKVSGKHHEVKPVGDDREGKSPAIDIET